MKDKDNLIEELGFQDFEEKYQKAFLILADLWDNMDTDRKKRMNIWSEFEGQTKALAHCYSDLEKYLNKLCSRFGTGLYNYQTAVILQEKKDKEYLDLFRTETQIPIMMLRLYRDFKKQKYNEKTKL